MTVAAEKSQGLAPDSSAERNAVKNEISQPPAKKPKKDWKPTHRRKAVMHKPVTAEPLRWPSKETVQYTYRDMWFYVAAKVASKGSHFRVLLALRQAIRTDTGTTTEGNGALADWAGGLSESGVSKVISEFSRLGIITVSLGFKPDVDGKERRSRTIGLAVPDPFPESISIDPDRNQVRARVLDELRKGGSQPPDSSSTRARNSAPRVLDSNKEADAAAGTAPVFAGPGSNDVEAGPGGGQPPTSREPSIQNPDANNDSSFQSVGGADLTPHAFNSQPE